MQCKKLGFLAAYYPMTKPLLCLLFNVKIAPETLPGSGVCLSAPSWFLSPARVNIFICQETELIEVWEWGKMLLIFFFKATQ